MKVVDRFEIVAADGVRSIELLIGDLAAIPAEHAVDVLTLSAFPGDYLPTRTSLIGALDRRGLSVAHLAQSKEWDLRSTFSCWMSRDIAESQGLNFRRILCFETSDRGRPEDFVSDIFHALAPFVFGPPHMRTVAMPVLAAGDQGHDFVSMLQALLMAGQHALSEGTPLDVVKIVVRDESNLEEARRVFTEAKRRTQPSKPIDTSDENVRSTVSPSRAVDVFVSYSRSDEQVATSLAGDLRAAGLSVFLDTASINHGAAWLEKIHDALDVCRAVVPIYSPDFLTSRACKWEFNIACAKNIETDGEFIFPILVRDAELPIYMRAINYRDCRISDLEKIRGVAVSVAVALGAKPPAAH
jgi:hypothetical protein